MTPELIEEIEEYWTERSRSYSQQNLEEMNSWKRLAWRLKILSEAPKGEKLRVLDIGTGPGFFAINLALAGHEVTAVDVTEEMLSHAKENAAAYGAEVNFVHHNGEALPFEDDSFDLVVNRNVVWNLQKPEQAFAEWKRVLRPGGRMVYFDANWYLYLFDEEIARKREEATKRMKRLLPGCQHHSELMPEEKTRMLEEIARSLPVSPKVRPAWDQKVLKEIGLEVRAIQEDVAPEVLSEREMLEYWATPLFMVCAEKIALQ